MQLFSRGSGATSHTSAGTTVSSLIQIQNYLDLRHFGERL